MTDDFITGLMKGAGGARGEAAYVAVEYDKQGNAVSISGLPDFAQKYVDDTITALRAEVERLNNATAVAVKALDYWVVAHAAAEAERDRLRQQVQGMTDDIVKRLLAHDQHPESASKQAADTITALRAEVETCKKYRDAYAECDRIATDALRKAEAERDRLREAAQEAARQLRIIAGMDMIGASAVAFNAARKLEAALTTKGEADERA